MDGTSKEIAKAAQEMAKATQDGIRATEKLGAFAARLIQEPADTVVGILNDRLRFIRWKRQERMRIEAEKLIRERNLQDNLLPVPPKLALPILENATLEEDDSLQDLWVRLLVAAADPAMQSRVRVAFIDVIKQLEPGDAKLLNHVHERAHEEFDQYCAELSKLCPGIQTAPPTKRLVSDFGIAAASIRDALNLKKNDYQVSVDNLMRQRCLMSYVEDEDIEVNETLLGNSSTFETTKDHRYDKICVTLFGCHFVETCMG